MISLMSYTHGEYLATFVKAENSAQNKIIINVSIY